MPGNSLSTISDTAVASVGENESAEGIQSVDKILAILALGYAVAYNDGVSRAKSGEVALSMWNGSFGYALEAAAAASPTLGVGYLGWSQGFKGECRQHNYCYYR